MNINSELLSLTNLIILVTCLISYMAFKDRSKKAQLIFHPVTIGEKNEYYRFLTSGFIHADGWHLGVNMFVLWSFGNAIERFYYPHYLSETWGITMYLGLYFGGIIVSSIPSFLQYRNAPHYSALGASGGVSAVVFAIIFFEPWENLYLYAAIPIPQIIAGLGYLYYSWYMDKKGTDNIGHMAHFTGAIWGIFFTGLMNYELFARFIQKTLEGPTWL